MTTAPPPVRVYPSEVVFRGIRSGPEYLATLCVQNVDIVPHRMRLEPPVDSHFVLNELTTVTVVPGLELKAELVFRCDDVNEYHDKVVLLLDSARIEIPVHAYGPSSDLQFNGFLDFGRVIQGHRMTLFVDIENLGEVSGDYQIVVAKGIPVTVRPLKGHLEAKPSRDADKDSSWRERIQVEFLSEQPGPFRGTLQVRLPSKKERTIDLCATVVDQKLEFLSFPQRQLLDSIDFGRLFFGERRTVSAVLVNNSPQSSSYSFSFPDALSSFSSHSATPTPTPSDSSRALPVSTASAAAPPARESSPLHLSHPSGIINAYEEARIDFTIAPPPPPVAANSFSHRSLPSESMPFHQILLLECPESGQNLSVAFSCEFVFPDAALSTSQVDFGVCPSGDRRDALLQLRNRSSLLPLSWETTTVAHFRVSPCKGLLHPSQSQELRVTFSPQQLGVFKNLIQFVFHGGIQILSLRVHGSSESVAAPARTHAESLRGPPKFLVVSVAPSGASGPSFRRPDAWESYPSPSICLENEGAFAGSLEESYTFGLSDHVKRKQHREHYNQFIRPSAPAAPSVSSDGLSVTYSGAGTWTDPEKDVNLGLPPHDGLPEPHLCLTQRRDGLWLREAIDEYGKVLGSGKHEVKLSVSDAKVFKSQPSSPAESKACETRLTEEELSSVQAGPLLLNYGRITTNSNVTEAFTVMNDLQQSIMVRLEILRDELKQSTPQCQVIPPGKVARFDIVFASKKEVQFEDCIFFTLNGQHKMKIRVLATVTPLYLVASREEVTFSFAKDNLEPSITELVKLRNPGTTDAEYVWSNTDEDPFQIYPKSGIIRVKESQEFQITFQPYFKCPLDQILKCVVNNGKTCIVRCVGDGVGSQLKVPEKPINFGLIPIGLPTVSEVRLQNPGPNAVVFWGKSSLSEVYLDPPKGQIEPGDSLGLRITVHPRENKVYAAQNSTVTLQTRGGPEYKLSLTAESRYPAVKINQDEFDFESVVVGSMVRKPIDLVNFGEIPAILVINFTNHLEFDLGDYEQTRYSQKSAVIPTKNAVAVRDRNRIESARDSKIFQILLESQDVLHFSILFSPKEAKSHNFELPITVLGLNNSDSLRRVISAEVVPPRLQLSHSFFDYGTQIVPYDRMKLIPYPQEVLLVNKDSSNLAWSAGDIETENPEDKAIFSVSPSSGTLIPGEVAKIRLEFIPEEAREYTGSFPFFINGETNKRYTTLTVVGRGVYPSLSFSTDEVILPVVPLQTKSVAAFRIINNGYDNLDLVYKLPLEGSKLPLTFTFPSGQKIQPGSREVPVIVSFLSSKPLSFTTRIDFYDKAGNRFSLSISGTADNCLLTNYGFIRSQQPDLSIYYDSKNVIQLIKSDIANKLKAGKTISSSKTGSAPDDAALGVSRTSPRTSPTSSPKSIAKKEVLVPTAANVSPSGENELFLIQFLNESLAPSPISSIESVISDQGSWISSLIEYLSNRKLQSTPKSLSQKLEDRTAQLMSMYSEILLLLKSYGALLNTVDASDLLPLDEYLVAKSDILMKRPHIELMENSTIKKLKNGWRDNYHTNCHSAWMAVLYQIVKIFSLQRITPQSYLSLPGMSEKKIADNDISSSPIYSVSECLLLRWFLYHHRKIHGGLIRKMYSFSEHVRSGVFLVHLLLSHVPDLNSEDRALYGYSESPKDEAACAANLEKVVQALKDLRISFVPEKSFFQTGDDRDLLLYFVYLYHSLVHFFPKATLSFQGELGQTMTKSIQLKNPSTKPISYEVEYSGCPDFQMKQQPLTLATDETLEFPISFLARFSKPMNGKLTFWGRKTLGAPCAPILFNLESKVLSKNPISVQKVKSPLYSLLPVDVEVKNPYPMEGRYEVTLVQRFLLDESDRSRTKRGKPGEAKSVLPDAEAAEVFDTTNAFYCPQKKLTVAGNGSAFLGVQFLPFYRGKYEVDLLFFDGKVGEFSYRLLGSSGLPSSLEKIRISTDHNAMIQRELHVNSQNAPLEKARQLILDRFAGTAKLKLKDLLKKSEDQLQTLPLSYSVEASNSFCVMSSSMMIQREEDDHSSLEAIVASSQTKLPNRIAVTFNPKSAGTYPCQLLIYRGSDFRHYEIDFIVNDKTNKTNLEFSVSARQSIVQEIPVTNPSDEPWELTAELSGEYFSGESHLTIAPKSTVPYHLKFSPAWICMVKGDLVLENERTGEKFYFSLKGVGDEPLPEDKLKFDCQARQEIRHSFTIPNDSGRKAKFVVESDIPHISGDPVFVVAAGESYTYDLSFHPLLGGSYFGTITFRRDDGRYYWYSVSLTVTSPSSDGEIEVRTVARQGSSLEISLSNPLDYAVDLDVILVGRGLLGDPVFHIEGGQTCAYELLFVPLIPGEQRGTVSFINQDIGEFWYELHLIADPPAVVTLERMVCPVGKRCSQTFVIENPVNEEVILKSKLSNKSNFIVRPPQLALKPYASGSVTLEYCPSSVNRPESTDLVYSHLKVGEFKYHAEGLGEEPHLMDPVDIFCEIHTSVSYSMIFRNPFPTELKVLVQLKMDSSMNVGVVSSFLPSKQSILHCVLSQKVHSIAAFGTLQVPLIFSPMEVMGYKGLLQITSVELPQKLTWSYPIMGIGEGVKSDQSFVFRCKARSVFRETFNVSLNCLDDSLATPESFHHELQVPEANRSLLERILELEPLLEVLNSPSQSLRYQLMLAPLRPATLPLQLIIHRSNGGQWRFPFTLEIGECDPDDVLFMNSTLNRTSSIGFSLTNSLMESAEFEAYFGPESPPNFSVSPTNGILPPKGAEGLSFIVSFTPREYGKPYIGRLIVNTLEMQWVFEVRGQHPEYSTPSASTRLNTHLDPRMERQLRQAKVHTTNHVSRNIVVAKEARSPVPRDVV